MATSKSWTAVDIEQGKFTVLNVDGVLLVERRYQFTDKNGDVLTNIAGGRLTREVAASSVPADVLAALTTINNWTYNQILAQEGMED